MSTQSTRRLVYVAILGALSFILMFWQFPLIPGVDFLQFEFSILPVLVALTLFDYKSALAVLFLRTVLKLIFANGGVGSLIGLPMNVIALGLFVASMALLWKKEPTTKNFVIAALVGTLVLTLAMIILNAIYAVPLYASFAGFDIKATLGLGHYLVGAVLPFNLIQGSIISLAFYLVNLAIGPLLSRMKVVN